MANPKRMKTWRRTPLSHKLNDQELSRIAREYRTWLCQHHGWFTDRRLCHNCQGTGRTLPKIEGSRRAWEQRRHRAGLRPWWTKEDEIDCPNCEGKGTVQLDEPILDLKRAESHVYAQQRLLDDLAQAAIGKIEAELRARGLRPVLYQSGSPVPQTIEEYDRLEALHASLRVEHDAAEEAAVAYRDKVEADYEAMDSEQKVGFLNNYEDTTQRATLRELEEKAGSLSRQLWVIRSHSGYWYQPGRPDVMWVSTERRRNYYGSPKATAEIVIPPGRSPGEGEITAIIDQALAELFPVELPVAA